MSVADFEWYYATGPGNRVRDRTSSRARDPLRGRWFRSLMTCHNAFYI